LASSSASEKRKIINKSGNGKENADFIGAAGRETFPSGAIDGKLVLVTYIAAAKAKATSESG
jgi:hypothetical protein